MHSTMTEHAPTHALVEHLFRERAGQLVSWLTRVFGPAHIALAEEVVQDALIKALQQWPFTGIPDNPSGWLFRVARNAALDALRRQAVFRDRATQIVLALNDTHAQYRDGWDMVDVMRDDELRMLFLCCHPALSADARVALSLKTVGGCHVTEIARAFLASEATIAQRLVRAKRQLRDIAAPFDLPVGRDLLERVDSVLETIYLMFSEGYSSHTGAHLVREELCVEALRLGRLVAGSEAVGTPTAHALVALMAFQSARLRARVDDNGELVLLEDQDPALWDRSLVAAGFRAFERSAAGPHMTAYHIQAAIAAVHASAVNPEATSWPRILALYDQLLALHPSPVIALNRAVAVAKVEGARAALASITSLEETGLLRDYYLLHSVKGRLLRDLGDHADAAAAFRRALACRCSEPEHRFLERQLANVNVGLAPE